MTQFFVEVVQKENKCAHCKASKLDGYSLCATHLDAAKKRWRLWAVERRAEGKCTYCHCKSFNGWLRCRKHTKINRAKCKEWVATHKEYSSEYNRQRKAKWYALDRCPGCPEHRKLDVGYRRCETCRYRQNQYKCA